VTTKTEEGINVIVEKTKQILKKEHLLSDSSDENFSYDDNFNRSYREMDDRSSGIQNGNKLSDNGENLLEVNKSFVTSDSIIIDDSQNKSEEFSYPKFEENLDNTNKKD